MIMPSKPTANKQTLTIIFCSWSYSKPLTHLNVWKNRLLTSRRARLASCWISGKRNPQIPSVSRTPFWYRPLAKSWKANIKVHTLHSPSIPVGHPQVVGHRGSVGRGLVSRGLHLIHHVGTLGKSFTHSCLWRFIVSIPTTYQCYNREHLWVAVDLKRRYRNIHNELMTEKI